MRYLAATLCLAFLVSPPSAAENKPTALNGNEKEKPAPQSQLQFFKPDLSIGQGVHSAITPTKDGNPSAIKNGAADAPINGFLKGQSQLAGSAVAPLIDPFNGHAVDVVNKAQIVRTEDEFAAWMTNTKIPEGGSLIRFLGQTPATKDEAKTPIDDDVKQAILSSPPRIQAIAVQRLAVNKRPAEAIEIADTAIAAAPGYAPTYAARGAAALENGDPRQAAADAQKALSLSPEDPFARGILRYAQTRLEFEEGVGRKAGDRAKRAGEGLKSFASSDDFGGEASKAAAGPAGTAASAAPQGTVSPAAPSQAGISVAGRSLLREAQASKGMGDLKRAVSLATRALALNGRHCDALNLRAELNNRLKQHRDAAEDATNSLAHCPGNVPALDLRSYAFSRMGQFRPALSDAGRSVQLQPQSPLGYLNRAEAEEGLGELRAMAQDLRKAATLDPQFLPQYRAKAEQYDLPVEPVTMGADPSLFAERGSAAKTATGGPPAAGRSQRLILWVLATLVGGFLIAAGLLHVLAGGWTQRRAAEPSGPAVPRAAAAVGEEGIRLNAPFVLRKPIGRGGMGVVYDAWDTSLERRVAIKKMREEFSQDPAEREHFIKEARLVAALEHPAIVGIHSIFEENDELYLVFEYVEGRTLDALLRAQGRVPLEEACRLLQPVCEALDYAHSRRVVHRDLKPANIMVTDSGKVKVMDFGIARAAMDTLARMSVTNTIAGTPLYMPPEAEQGLVSQSWDVYSLGVLAYELLTGRPPYPVLGLGPAKLGRTYARLSTVDPILVGTPDAAVHAALDPDPDRRPESALHFWESLSGKTTPPRSKVRA